MLHRLEPRQLGDAAPSQWENALADMLEAAFAAGIHDLPGLVARLNKAGLRPPDGAPWTEARFTAIMHRLGAL